MVASSLDLIPGPFESQPGALTTAPLRPPPSTHPFSTPTFGNGLNKNNSEFSFVQLSV